MWIHVENEESIPDFISFPLQTDILDNYINRDMKYLYQSATQENIPVRYFNGYNRNNSTRANKWMGMTFWGEYNGDYDFGKMYNAKEWDGPFNSVRPRADRIASVFIPIIPRGLHLVNFYVASAITNPNMKDSPIISRLRIQNDYETNYIYGGLGTGSTGSGGFDIFLCEDDVSIQIQYFLYQISSPLSNPTFYRERSVEVFCSLHLKTLSYKI